MKTYTFKIKLHYCSQNYPVVLSVVHCPLEVLFDSLKEVKQFEELYKAVKDENNKEVPSMYITASDYVNNNGEYVFNEYIFCEYKAIIESSSLTELLTSPDYFGFIEGDISTATTEQQSVIESYELHKAVAKKLKKESEEDEV